MTGIESIIKFLIKLGWPVVKVVKFLTTGVKRTVKKIKNVKKQPIQKKKKGKKNKNI